MNKNKTLKVAVISSLITAIIVGGIGVTAVALTAKDIGFTSTHEGWEATNVNDAINDLYKIGEYEITPDTYFYDSKTSGEEIVRYKKFDGKYYLCDQNGNITNEIEQDVSSTTLVEYKTAISVNISAGSAGYADGKFILGNAEEKMKDFKITLNIKNEISANVDGTLLATFNGTATVTYQDNELSYTTDYFINQNTWNFNSNYSAGGGIRSKVTITSADIEFL